MYDETFMEMYGQLEGFRPRRYIYIFISAWGRKTIPNFDDKILTEEYKLINKEMKESPWNRCL